MSKRHGLVLAFALLSAATANSSSAPSSQRQVIKIATWNLEWLLSPQAFKSLKADCALDDASARGEIRRLPCDVASRLERSSRDFSVLARYARELDADVVAVQETDGADAARLVFPGYDFCFTDRKHVQNTGFAVRRG